MNYTVLLENKNTKIQKNIYNGNKNKLLKQVSPLRYPGGKSKIVDLLYSYMDKNKKTFIDVFCGGGSVGLSLLLSGVIDNLIINDLDYGVYSFFYEILNHPQRLIKKINTIMPTRELFFYYRAMIKDNYKNFDKEEIAFGFLLVNRCSFSGIYNSNPMTDILQRWNPQTMSKKILNIYNYKENITLMNVDAIELIKKFSYNDNLTLFIDPPYVIAKKVNLYHINYNYKNHIELANVLNSLSLNNSNDLDILVTYDDVDFIRNLYKDYSKIEILPRNYSINNNIKT